MDYEHNLLASQETPEPEPDPRDLVVYMEGHTHPEGILQFQQGGLRHEIHDVVTAEDCRRWIDEIAALHKLISQAGIMF